MLALLVSGSLFVAVAAAIIVFGYREYVKPGKSFEQLASPVSGLTVPVSSLESDNGSFRVRRFAQWVGEKVPADPQIASLTRRELMAAGFRSDAALAVFHGVRVLAAGGALVLAVLATRLTDWPMKAQYAAWIAAPILAYMFVNLGLELLVKREQDILRCSLPDALDLLIVAVEAGIGLDQALKRVSDELHMTHPAVSREFGLVSLETRSGVSRADALRNMADRTMEPEMKKFVAVMVQTDRFGTSIAESLRSHSDFMRVRRRQLAEEKANKLGVKLTIVVFFFILPAILIVSGGPAFLRIAHDLLPALRSLSGS